MFEKESKILLDRRQRRSVRKLKSVLTSPPILAMPKDDGLFNWTLTRVIVVLALFCHKSRMDSNEL